MMSFLLPMLGGLTLAVCAELFARRHVRRSPYRVLAPGRVDRMSLHHETLPTLDQHIAHAVNSHGERGGERPADPRTFRVLVAGGSAVSCFLLDQEVAWPSIMQRQLQSAPELADRPVHVGNIGKSSIDSATLDYMLSKVLPQEDGLDVLVVMVGASDILRWLALGAPVHELPDLLPIDDAFAERPDIRFGWKPKQLALATLYRRHREAKGWTRTNFGKRYGAARRMRAEARTITDVPDASLVMERFEERLESLVDRALEHVEHVVVVRQPWFEKAEYSEEEVAQFWNGSIGDAYMTPCDTFFSHQVVAELCRQLDERVVVVAERAGVPTVNVNAHLEPSTATYIDQFHFTPLGSQLVAQAVRDGVLDAVHGAREHEPQHSAANAA
ncbi:MAG: hypothetical protein IT355_15200 [Gemmatimonadaceae bacterium]|nr:hypothetical protein [Gemmatimonadaceae bacterium]